MMIKLSQSLILTRCEVDKILALLIGNGNGRSAIAKNVSKRTPHRNEVSI